MPKDPKICVGMITGAHGVRGLVRLRSFMENPKSIGGYDSFTDEEGARSFVVTLKNEAKDYFIASIEGVASCEAAQELRGTHLYIARASLPKIEPHAFYEADLINLAVHDRKGTLLGRVRAVHNYGGGPFLEMGTSEKDSVMVPFTDVCVPKVDLKKGIVTIDLPPDWGGDEKKPKQTPQPKPGAKSRSPERGSV